MIREQIEQRPFEYGGHRVEHKALDKSVQGNALWVLFETITTDIESGEERLERQKWIALFLLASKRGYGWGYKDMEESMGSYTFSCPLRFLDAAPVACAEWREGVRAYWQDKAEKKKLRRSLKPGQVVRLDSATIPEVEIVSVSGRRILGKYNDRLYRVPLRFLGEVVAAS